MTDITQRLPVELLSKILENVSVLDVLRFKQVNRIFCDVILASPLIQHKIDLFAAGLEYNAAAGAGLAESQNAFHQYRSNWDSLRPIEKKAVDNIRIPDRYDYGFKAAGGVYSIVKESVRLITLGSASRGIPHKVWEIPLPCTEVTGYNFYPGADVIAFVEVRNVVDMRIVIHLKALSNGARHPAARCPKIRYSWGGANLCFISSVSITSSRLVVLMGVQSGMHVVVWDWKNGQILFTLQNDRFHSVDFIDDYRLLAILESPCIVLMDTENAAGGAPVQTLFHLPPHFGDFEYPPLLLEQGAYKPPPAESLAPFHQDPAQWIVALSMPDHPGYLVLPVEALLKLAEDREGCEIGWDEWKHHVVIPSIRQQDLDEIWVSGCRLFSVTSAVPSEDVGSDVRMEVYDFSIQGRAKYLTERVNADLGGVRYMAPTGANLQLPWEIVDLRNVNGGQDSIVFVHLPPDFTDDFVNEGTLHTWAF